MLRLFRNVTVSGDTYVYEENLTDEEIHGFWFDNTRAYVAVEDRSGALAGMFVIRDNKPGRGSHICNAGFMVDEAFRRRGIGGAMCRRALEEAAKAGYRGMQFNVVVSTNAASIALWKKCGFTVIGTVPGGFRHKIAGYTDIHLMYRSLEDI